MKNTEIPFDVEELLSAAEDVVQNLRGEGKVTLRTTRVQWPDPAPDLEPAEILEARQKLNVSQPVFARLLNVPTGTAISWEKGRRKPSGAALRLLQIAREQPEFLLALQKETD